MEHKGLVIFFLTWVLSGFAVTAFSQVPKWKQAEIQGDTLYKRQEFKDAIRSYTRAIELNQTKDKDSYRTVYKRAICYYSIGDYKNALKDVETFEPQFPNVPQAKILKSFLYRELGDDEKQLESLEAAMELQPPDAELLKWRGLLYLQKDNYVKTKADMLLARQLQDDSEIETYLGMSYYNLDQHDSAFVSFNKAIELDATYAPSYLYASSMALEEGNFKLALEYASLNLRLDSQSKEALFYKGIALVELDKKDEGCRCLNRAFYLGMDEASGYLTEYCFEVDN
ncbi:MAG: hypothetical protein HOP08_03815 [Cyclobacteriaceae bacterium]|nr:hypothetical protein [Cyclobacteriaceae bacterium]